MTVILVSGFSFCFFVLCFNRLGVILAFTELSYVQYDIKSKLFILLFKEILKVKIVSPLLLNTMYFFYSYCLKSVIVLNFFFPEQEIYNIKIRRDFRRLKLFQVAKIVIIDLASFKVSYLA